MQNFSLSKNYKILGIYCEKMKKKYIYQYTYVYRISNIER